MRQILVVAFMFLIAPHATADFVETFNGTGPFSSAGDVLEGFDNPGWAYLGDGVFRDGGLWVENSPPPSNASDRLERQVNGNGDLEHVLEIRDHSLFTDDTGTGNANVRFAHRFDASNSSLVFVVHAIPNDLESYRIFMGSGDNSDRVQVEQGPHIRLSMFFDADMSQVSYSYDNNLDDELPPTILKTLDYTGVVSQEGKASLSVGVFEAQVADALIDHWTFTSSEPPIFPGDFNRNGIFDAEDIDLLNAEIRSGSNNPDFDLVEDGIVDHFDRTFWVHTINNTYFGDANLDGEFNSGDLVAVFQAGQYEDGSMAGWAAGDWNGDAEFTSNDLVVAFQDGGYEVGPRQVANAVPEPSSWLLLLLGLVALRCKNMWPSQALGLG